MTIKKWLAAAFAVASLAAGWAQAVQNVDFANITKNNVAVTSPISVSAGDVIRFDVMLTQNGTTGVTSGLGLCLDYKSTTTGDPVISALFGNQISANGQPQTLTAACNIAGGTIAAGADKQVIKGWADSLAVGWPTDTLSTNCTATACPPIPLPVKLYTATFTIPAGAVSGQIGLAASSVSSGETFSSNSPLVLNVVVVVPPPTITKAFGAASIALNASTTLSFTITNPNAGTSLTGISFTDTLPAGMVVSTPGVITGSCPGGVIGAPSGGGVVLLTAATLAASGTCTFSVNVTGTTAGVKNNTVTASSTESGPGVAGTASVTVVAPVSPQTITKAFGAANIPVNGSTSLTFTITNPNAGSGLTGVAFTDTLPAGMVVSTPNALTGACGGTVTAVAGSGSVSLAGGTLAASASCTISVNVTGTTLGAKNNTVTASSTEGGASAAGTATVTVAALSAPSIAKSFGAASVPVNGTTSLTFVVGNSNTGTSLTGVAFTDNLPAGMVVSTPNGLAGSCGGGTISASGGAVSLSGATLAASSSCTFTVNVTVGSTLGGLTNTTGAVSSTNGGTGSTATANLTVVAAPPTLTVIPTLSSWMLMLLAGMLAVASMLYMRKREG